MYILNYTCYLCLCIGFSRAASTGEGSQFLSIIISNIMIIIIITIMIHASVISFVSCLCINHVFVCQEHTFSFDVLLLLLFSNTICMCFSYRFFPPAPTGEGSRLLSSHVLLFGACCVLSHLIMLSVVPIAKAKKGHQRYEPL